MFTEQDYAEFCMMMRVVSFMRSNEDVFSGDAEILEATRGLQESVAGLLELLDEKERDHVLERYREETRFLERHGDAH